MASPVRNPAVRRGDVERRAAGSPGGRGAQREVNARGDRSARPRGIMGMARCVPQRLNQADAKLRGPSSRRLVKIPLRCKERKIARRRPHRARCFAASWCRFSRRVALLRPSLARLVFNGGEELPDRPAIERQHWGSIRIASSMERTMWPVTPDQ